MKVSSYAGDLHSRERKIKISLEDQEKALSSILSIAKTNNIDAMILAETSLIKEFHHKCLNLFQLPGNCKKSDIPVHIIAGNHDDASRLSCYATILQTAPSNCKTVSSTPQYDDLCWKETVRIHFLTLYKLLIVRTRISRTFLKKSLTYSDAVKFALSLQLLLQNAPNILIAHQFVIDDSSCPNKAIQKISPLVELIV